MTEGFDLRPLGFRKPIDRRDPIHRLSLLRAQNGHLVSTKALFFLKTYFARFYCLT